LLPDFKSLASPTIKDGKNALFWIDSWHDGPLQLSMPELYSYAKNNRISVNKVFETENLADLFYLPLSQVGFLQFQELQQIRESSQLSDQKNIWVYEWGSRIFASTKVYRRLVGHHIVHVFYRWLWKYQCQPKHKVFFGF
jgi:hypothetical protein